MSLGGGTKNYGKRFFSGVALLTISTFIVKLIGMLYKLPMMAYLGATGMGYFNSAYEIYSLFFVISTTGIPVAISILISESRARGRAREAARIFKVSMSILLALGLLGTLITCIFYEELAALISNDGAAYSILAISPTLLLICIGSAVRGYFQGEQEMLPTAVSQIIEAAGKLVLGLGLAAYAVRCGYGLEIAAALAALGLSLGVAISTLYLVLYKLLRPRERCSPDDASPTPSSFKLTRRLLAIAVPITLSSTILSLTKLIDMTMILKRLGDLGYTQEQANAIYGSYSTMAVPIYNLPSTFTSAIAMPLVPMLASAIESGERQRERAVISSSLRLTSLISFPAGLGIAVFAEPILELLFPKQAEEIEYTAPLLALLGLSVFLSSMISVTNAILQAYKQVRKPIISMAVGTGVKLVLDYILIGLPEVNVYGAPISTFFSVAVVVSMNICYIVQASGRLGSLMHLFGRAFAASVVSVAVGAAIYYPLTRYVESRAFVLPVILVVVIAYLVAALKFGAICRDEILLLPGGEKIFGILNKIGLVKK